MNKPIMMMVALSMGAGMMAQAQDNGQFDFGDWAKDSFTLFNAEREGAPNSCVQEFSLKFRGQFQGAFLDPAGGTDRVKGGADGHGKRDNNEWRRFRVGAQAKVFEHFTLKVMLGAEYINSHGTDASGIKGFTGWQLSSGVRWDF